MLSEVEAATTRPQEPALIVSAVASRIACGPLRGLSIPSSRWASFGTRQIIVDIGRTIDEAGASDMVSTLGRGHEAWSPTPLAIVTQFYIQIPILLVIP